MIGIELHGYNKMIAMAKKADSKLALKGIMKKAGNDAKKLCRDKYVPVDKGDLKKSVFVEIMDDAFILGANARHGVYNEYGSWNLTMGTPRNPVDANKEGYRPFIRPTLIEIRSQYPEIFRETWERIMHGG